MCIKKVTAFNCHDVIGYSGNRMMVVDYDFDTVTEICRIRLLNKDTAEENTRFYLDKDSIDNLIAVLCKGHA